jgi:hypothetical protein
VYSPTGSTTQPSVDVVLWARPAVAAAKMTKNVRHNVLIAPFEITGAVVMVERVDIPASAFDRGKPAAIGLSCFIVFLPKKIAL